MPELPEVETVRRGLAPVMEGALIQRVERRRPDLRFPFPRQFVKRLEGARVLHLDRRGKYLLAALSTDETLIMHLGMSGRFTIEPLSAKPKTGTSKPGVFKNYPYEASPPNPVHDHVVIELSAPAARRGARKVAARVTYNDPRRFGFMDLAASHELDQCRHFAAMGPEPLGNGFSPESFAHCLKTRASPIKAALLDQKVVAGVGNIYACEALYRAGVSPRRKASSVAGARSDRLHEAVVAVLREAIEAGGSSLKDFAASDGALGYFQHRFQVYDREGAPCSQCGKGIKRLVQSGRSTFYCGACQK